MHIKQFHVVNKAIFACAVLLFAGHGYLRSADLWSQFYVPQSGHIVLDLSWPAVLHGLRVTTVDDVMKLHDALSLGPLDDASVKTFAYLRAAGIERPPLPPVPPPPPGRKVTVINDRPPDWQVYHVHLDGGSMRQVLKGNLGDRVFVHTADSDIVLSNSVSSGQVTHGLSGTSHDRKFDMNTLFTRSSSLYSRNGWEQLDGYSQRRFRLTNANSFGWIIASPDSDHILGRVAERSGAVSSFALHLRPRRFQASKIYFLPELTCEFFKTAGEWKFVSYLLRQVELDVPIDARQFNIALEKGNVYVNIDTDGKSKSINVVKPIGDIARNTPDEVFKTIVAGQAPSGPRASIFAICTGLLFLLAAGAWTYRAFCATRSIH